MFSAVMLNAVKHLITPEQVVLNAIRCFTAFSMTAVNYLPAPARGVERTPQEIEGAQDLLKKVRE